MEMKYELITPERAQEMLSNNPHNRKLGVHTWSYYKKEMDEGRWKQTGEPIQINTKDELINGQHRLTALVRGNHSIWFWVAYDVPDDAKAVIDTGKMRNAQDYLTLSGVDSASIVAAIVRMLHLYTQGKMSLTEEYARKLDHEQIYNLYLQTPGIDESVNVARHTGHLGSGSLIGFCHYVISRVDRVGAHDFFARLATGENLDKNSPILFCRTRLQRIKAEKRHKRKDERKYVAMTIFKSWNAYAENRRIAHIRMVENTTFPLIKARITTLETEEPADDSDDPWTDDYWSFGKKGNKG